MMCDFAAEYQYVVLFQYKPALLNIVDTADVSVESPSSHFHFFFLSLLFIYLLLKMMPVLQCRTVLISFGENDVM